MLAAFGCDGFEPELLPGGEGRSWRCGDVVLKPVDDVEQAVWTAEVLTTIDFADVVVPQPVRSADGAWVVDGWTAMQYVDARHETRRWRDIIAAGRAFHAAIAAVERPAWMDRADDWWRRADRVAWDDSEAVGDPALVSLVDRLRARRTPLELPNQVIHADLCGNVLFDAHDRPVVIDFSP